MFNLFRNRKLEELKERLEEIKNQLSYYRDFFPQESEKTRKILRDDIIDHKIKELAQCIGLTVYGTHFINPMSFYFVNKFDGSNLADILSFIRNIKTIRFINYLDLENNDKIYYTHIQNNSKHLSARYFWENTKELVKELSFILKFIKKFIVNDLEHDDPMYEANVLQLKDGISVIENILKGLIQIESTYDGQENINPFVV